MRPSQRNKLLIGLTAYEVLSELNEILKQNQVKLILDFDQPDKLARLYVQIQELTPELWKAVDTRKRVSFISPCLTPTTRKVVVEIEKLLHEQQAHLVFMAEKPRNKKPVCKLQMHVVGARSYALTMAEAFRGEIVTETEFTTPDGEAT